MKLYKITTPGTRTELVKELNSLNIVCVTIPWQDAVLANLTEANVDTLLATTDLGIEDISKNV